MGFIYLYLYLYHKVYDLLLDLGNVRLIKFDNVALLDKSDDDSLESVPDIF